MGSGKLLKTKTPTTMEDEKKSLINTFKNAFKWIKRGAGKGSKEPKNENNVKNEEKISNQAQAATPVVVLLEKLERKKDQEENNEDELKLFTHKLIETEPREIRESQSSDDSGFSGEKEAEDLTQKLKALKVEEGEPKIKKKSIQTVVISRGPVKGSNYTSKSHPYPTYRQDEHGFRQTLNIGEIQSQINTQTLSGGHVIVKDPKPDNIFLAQAVNNVEQCVENYKSTTIDEQEFNLSLANEYISKEMTAMQFSNSYQAEESLSFLDRNWLSFTELSPATAPISSSSGDRKDPTLNQLICINDDESFYRPPTIFPTPPRSENVPSPMSDSFFHCSSPTMSSPMRSNEMEIYQQFVDYPEVEEEAPKTVASHNMKHYKDLQKELSSGFSKMDCCQKNRPQCREIFREHVEKLKKEDRLRMNLNVAMMKTEDSLATLRFLIVKLSKESARGDEEIVLFCLICNKMLMEQPGQFVGDFGLELLEAAVHVAYSKPFLTRYLVECIRVDMKNVKIGAEDTHLFKETNKQGENLFHDCVRRGDQCADVLGELVRRDVHDVPLFNVHHSNSDGYTPLHLACIKHSAAESRLHISHILMEHAGADLWLLDVKGGDTALHLAVNSYQCDINLIMVIFHHFERNQWKGLAQAQNRSSVTVRDYARSASRSSSRTNYPPEVLEFLKKCR